MKADYAPKFRLAFRADELRAIGVQVTRNGKVRGKVKTLKLADAMRQKFGGVTLLRRNEVTGSAVSAEALLARYSDAAVADEGKKAGTGKRRKRSAKANAKRSPSRRS